MRTLLWTFILSTSAMLVSAGYMDTVFEWKYIDYLWPSKANRQAAIRSGAYDYSNVLPMDVDRSRDGRYFISFLGTAGVPARLGVVTNLYGPSGPLINPYPNWSWFRSNDCNSIINVYRITIDKCNRLWVLDTGFVEGQPKNCPSQLLAFDLATDTLYRRIKIPNNIAGNREGRSLLATPIVETSNCYNGNETVYMADTDGNGLVMLANNRLFRLEHPVFADINPEASNLVVGGYSMDATNGILGMDVSPQVFRNEPRYLYFHSLGSFDLFAAETNSLRNSIYNNNIRFTGTKYFFPSHSIAHAFASQGTLFFGLTKEVGIGCWNRYREMNTNNIVMVAQDSERLQYANGVKVASPLRYNDDETVLVLTNRFPAALSGGLNFNRVNFRVMSSPVQRLIAGTRCELPIFD